MLVGDSLVVSVTVRHQTFPQTVNGANDVTDKSEHKAQRMNGAKVSNATEQEAHDTNVGDESESQVVTVPYFNCRSEMDCCTMNGFQLQVVGAGRSPPSGNNGVNPCLKRKVYFCSVVERYFFYSIDVECALCIALSGLVLPVLYFSKKPVRLRQ